MTTGAPAAVEPPERADKCRRVGRRLAFYCGGMTMALKGQTEEGKGLAEMHSFVDGVPDVQLVGIVYRPKSRAAGVVLNVCPWCSESLRWWPEAKQATEGA
jgi:hypothetical protein